jgi:aminoglycoside/choline kinase family phosphotransferase
MTGFGTWARRLERIGEIAAFLAAHPPWSTSGVRYLQGDASTRAYARLAARGNRAVLMDQARQPDGPPIRDGLPYSRIAHLAEDVRPFVAVQGALRDAGLSVPEIYAADLGRGLIVLEDLGDRVFGREMEGGTPQAELWRAAADALVALAAVPVPDELQLPGGAPYRVPAQDRGVLEIETELLLDWYWPAVKGAPVPADVRAEFHAAWTPVFDRILAMPAQWILRDYHSPNLIWLPERSGVARVGILDFQDALRGPAAYDLVSLLEDARVDVPPDLEDALFVYYCAACREQNESFDRDTFAFAYAALGAQRNTKILGIFARLAQRDGKPLYLRHIPRLWRYLARNLAHPDLISLRAWYDRHFPPESRDRVLEA